MWPSHIAKPMKRAPTKRSADDGDDFGRRSGMDDLRGRHPMFRMPAWMSEDEDMSDLAARMSHTPHFATMGRRGGPWRERRSSGGSAMSGTSDDSCDAPTTDKSSQCSGGSSEVPSHEIPIRIEAPCPPSMEHQSQQQQQQPQQQQQQQEQQQLEENEPISPLSSRLNHARKIPQYPMRTTSATDATHPREDFQRNTRCSSAPPEMADQPLPQEAQKQPHQQQRFVSKINITPQSPQSPNSPRTTSTPFSPLPAKFNTVPKPFVPVNKQQSETQQQPSSSEQQPIPEQQNPQNNQYQTYQPQYQPQQQQHQPQQQFHQQQQHYQPQQQQHYQPQQQYHQQQQSPRPGSQRPSVVRNIPIFVEGRDGPVNNEESHTPPKAAPQWGQSWQQNQQQQQPQPPQQQQQKPQQKSQFRQQHTQPQAQQSQPIPHPMPAPPPPQHQPQHQPQQQTAQPEPPKPQPKPQAAKDPRLTKIEAVQALVDEYKAKVDTFSGTKKDREFLYLDEMLTRALLQLDNVDPDGREDVRQARRAVIKNINAAISALEARASDSKDKNPENAVVAMDTDTQEQPVETTSQEKPAETKDSQEPTDKNSTNNESSVSLPGGSSEKPSEAKVESMETSQTQEGTTSTNKEKETEAATST